MLIWDPCLCPVAIKWPFVTFYRSACPCDCMFICMSVHKLSHCLYFYLYKLHCSYLVFMFRWVKNFQMTPRLTSSCHWPWHCGPGWPYVFTSIHVVFVCFLICQIISDRNRLNVHWTLSGLLWLRAWWHCKRIMLLAILFDRISLVSVEHITILPSRHVKQKQKSDDTAHA